MIFVKLFRKIKARIKKKKKKKQFRFLLRMKKKLTILFLCVAGVLVVMIGRLGFIEVKSGERYEKIVLSNQEYGSTTIPFRRGDIVDRKGTVLATSTDVYNVILDCSVLTSKESYLEPTMEALRECFREEELNYSFEEIRAFIADNKDSRYLKIAEKLPAEEIEAFEALQEKVNYGEEEEYSFFGTVMTAMSNRFVVSFMEDNYGFQEILLNFIKENYESFSIQQKSNAAYWLGRISYKNLASEAMKILNEEFEKYKPLVKKNNKNTQENCDNHFLFRSICTGLLSQEQTNILDEYLCLVVTNDIANAVNRGAVIEYFGDNYQMAAHDAYYLDTDLSTGEQAIHILNSRIENALSGESKKFVEKNLVTMLTLLQARIQNRNQTLKFDIRPYVEKALEYIAVYRTRPQNIVSGKLLFYFRSVEDDLKAFLESDEFDIGPMIYSQYRGLRLVKRSQWTERNIEDPESISEHTYSAWLLAMIFLPEENDVEGYLKREILDMLLVHDMAEAIIGDQTVSLCEPTRELKSQNEVLKKLFLKGTYPDIANLTHYYNVWTGYYEGMNINARIARDINLIQTVYTFCEYYCIYPDHFPSGDVRKWMKEKNNLKTDIGYQLFDRLITQNKEFSAVFETEEY